MALYEVIIGRADEYYQIEADNIQEAEQAALVRIAESKKSNQDYYDHFVADSYRAEE